MAADTSAPAAFGPVVLRRAWLLAIVLCTVAPVLLGVAFGPDGLRTSTRGLVWLLFVGSSMHIGATAWFYLVPEVRSFMLARPGRYVVAPIALIAGGALLASGLAQQAFTTVLLAFFGWQFFHFQRQNLGVSALAARAFGAKPLTRVERGCLTGCGLGGIVVLLGRPGLLGLDPSFRAGSLVPLGTAVYLGAAGAGLVALAARRRGDRPPAFAVVLSLSLAFFAPVIAFDRPFAAVAGVTIAHGLQYLLLVGMLAAAPTDGSKPLVGVLVLANLALVVGLALNRASHLHDGGPLARSVYGAYVGVLAAHFVIDAGLWRLRDEFPRAFLSTRMPYLLVP